MKIAIIGAGFTGLSAAYYLTKKGHEVEIFEKDAKPGGLAVGYKEKEWDWTLEHHYHHWFTNDKSVLSLAREINHKVISPRPVTSSFVEDGIYQLDSPISLLKFPKLNIFERIRMGISLAFLRFNPFWKPLEKYKAEPYLKKSMGKKGYKMLWEPLMVNKLGKYAKDVSLAWFWARVYKRTPRLSYPEGGFLSFANHLQDVIEKQGGIFHYETEITNLTSDTTPTITYKKKDAASSVYDKVIVTLPSMMFAKIAPTLPEKYLETARKRISIGAVNLVMRLSEKFLKDGTYWLSMCELESPILAIVEHTNYMNPRHYNNEHVVYVGNYMETSDKRFTMPDEDLFKIYDPWLMKINPVYKDSLIDYKVFRAPFAQPIIFPNYSKNIPSSITPLRDVFLANIEQVYPWDRGTNYAVELGEKISKLAAPEKFSSIMKKKGPVLLLFLIVIVGAFLRFYNINWDNFLIFHPDERNIDAAVSRISFFSQLNPGFFAYGGFPMYLYRAFGDLMDTVFKSSLWTSDWGHINIIGRSFSAFFSSLTIIAVYFLGKKVFNTSIAIIAAIIFAFSVSSIQISHYATTESLLIFLLTIISYVSLCIYKKQSYKLFFILGIISGIGVASKTTALSFMISPALVFLVLLFQRRRKDPFALITKIVLFLVITAITFTLFSPYTLLTFNKFSESMNYESGVATGRLVVPYTHQFDRAIPYLFELINMFWQMGPIFLFSLIGFLLLLFKDIKKPAVLISLTLLFPMVYFLYVGTWHAKFIRYMSILLPFFALYASYALYSIITRFKKIGVATLLLFLGLTIFWAFSYMSVYIHPQTRYLASVWMYKNIKPGDKVYTEHWDDGLPIHIDGVTQSIPTEQLTIYDNEFSNKAQYYAEKLSQGNYVILVTRRLYGSLMYLPKEYPVTSVYYKDLFSGKLGYEKVAEFSSYPSLFGITINDDASEESFQVYDHPKVLIFKNVRKFDEKNLWNILKS